VRCAGDQGRRGLSPLRSEEARVAGSGQRWRVTEATLGSARANTCGWPAHWATPRFSTVSANVATGEVPAGAACLLEVEPSPTRRAPHGRCHADRVAGVHLAASEPCQLPDAGHGLRAPSRRMVCPVWLADLSTVALRCRPPEPMRLQPCPVIGLGSRHAGRTGRSYRLAVPCGTAGAGWSWVPEPVR